VVLHNTEVPRFSQWHSVPGKRRMEGLVRYYRDDQGWSANSTCSWPTTWDHGTTQPPTFQPAARLEASSAETGAVVPLDPADFLKV
jgi:hypothetical protein